MDVHFNSLTNKLYIERILQFLLIELQVMEYEYEAGMERSYQESLTKAFKKTISDGYFSFVIVDAINDKIAHFEEMWNFAKMKGFQV